MKSIRKIMTASLFLLVMLAAVVSGTREAQAGSSVTFREKKMVSQTTDSITVKWDVSCTDADVVSYEVSYRERYSPSEDYIPAASGLSPETSKYTIKGLKSGTLYFVRVGVKYRSKINNEVYSFGEYITDAFTAAGAVTGLEMDTWLFFKHQLVVSWKSQSGADGYEVEARKSSKERYQLQKVPHGYTRTATFTNIKNEMVYTVRIRAYQKVNGNKVYTSWSDPITCFAQAPIKTLKIRHGKLIIKWGKVTGANGYRIYVSTKPSRGYKMVREVPAGTASAKIAKFGSKKFNAKKNYFVYVQTLKTVDGKVCTSPKLYSWDTKKMQVRAFK